MTSTYLVTDRLDLTTNAEVDKLEETLGFQMPRGYRGYITELGEGEYCDILRLYPPKRVLENRHLLQTSFKAHRFFDRFPAGYSEKEIYEAVIFADTSNGDYFAIHPKNSQNVLCFPEGDSVVTMVSAKKSRLIDLYWSSLARDESLPDFRYFESWVNRARLEAVNRDSKLEREAFLTEFTDHFGPATCHRVDTSLPTVSITRMYSKAVQGYVYLSCGVEEQSNIDRVVVVYDANLTERAQWVRKLLSPYAFKFMMNDNGGWREVT